MGQQQQVYLRLTDGRIAAVLRGRTLCRRFRASKHMLQKPPALCIDAKLYDAYRAQFDTLCFVDEDSGREYTVDARVFDARRFTIQRGGYPPQYACPLKYWQVDDPNNLQLTLMGVNP